MIGLLSADYQEAGAGTPPMLVNGRILVAGVFSDGGRPVRVGQRDLDGHLGLWALNAADVDATSARGVQVTSAAQARSRRTKRAEAKRVQGIESIAASTIGKNRLPGTRLRKALARARASS
jgi:hypothetical protein